MAAPTATGAPVPDPTTTRAITVSWPPVEGTGPTGGRSPSTPCTSTRRRPAAGLRGTAVDTEHRGREHDDSAPFTVNNDSSWYEYAVTATNQAGASAQSPQSSPAVQAAAPPDAPTGVTATATGQSNTIQFSFTAPAANAKQISSIEYGINAASETGTITGPFTAGSTATVTLTNAMNSAIVNGKAVTVYVAECNDASLCSSWAGPSGQVTPYEPIANPTVNAIANGTTIAYTWSAHERRAGRDPERLHHAARAPTTRSPRPAATAARPPPPTATARRKRSPPTSPTRAAPPASARSAPPRPRRPPPNPTVSVAKGNVEPGRRRQLRATRRLLRLLCHGHQLPGGRHPHARLHRRQRGVLDGRQGVERRHRDGEQQRRRVLVHAVPARSGRRDGHDQGHRRRQVRAPAVTAYAAQLARRGIGRIMTTATAGAPVVTSEQANWFARAFGALVTNVEQAVLGKQHIVRLALTCLVSEGHLLLEDFPGTGKTSLAKAIANSVQGTHSRIQFTPDLLPSDVTGVTIYDQRSGQFTFHGGPIFATIVLADEINRASPKTQSALLEVMEEGRVTVDGTPHPVGRPFMVIATQNPIEQAGTYRLPEAQLDRFLMKTSLGYPDHAVDRRAARVRGHQGPVRQRAERDHHAGDHPDVARSPTRCTWTRRSSATSASSRRSRASSGTSGSGSASAAASPTSGPPRPGRSPTGGGYVVPDDIKELAIPVLSHRLLLDAEAEFSGVTVEDVIGQLLSQVRPPTSRGA